MEQTTENLANEELKLDSSTNSEYLLVRTVTGCYQEISGFRRLTQQLYERIVLLEADKAKQQLIVQLLCKRIAALEEKLAGRASDSTVESGAFTQHERELVQELLSGPPACGDDQQQATLNRSLENILRAGFNTQDPPAGVAGRTADFSSTHDIEKMLTLLNKSKSQVKREGNRPQSDARLTLSVKPPSGRKGSASSPSRRPSRVKSRGPGDTREAWSDATEKKPSTAKRPGSSAARKANSAAAEAQAAHSPDTKRKGKKKKKGKRKATQQSATETEKAISPVVSSMHQRSDSSKPVSKRPSANSRQNSAARMRDIKPTRSNVHRDGSEQNRTKQQSVSPVKGGKKKGRRGRSGRPKQKPRPRSSSNKAVTVAKNNASRKNSKARANIDLSKKRSSDKPVALAKVLKNPPAFAQLGGKKKIDPRVAVKIKGFKFRALTTDEKKELEQKARELLERRDDEDSSDDELSSFTDEDDDDSFSDSEYDSESSFTESSSGSD